MSNTDLMNDAELVECAKEMRAVFYQGTHVKWESLVRVEAAAWLRIASFTRDFFRERWKPEPMPTPDFSRDHERVQLAKALQQAFFEGGWPHAADAAITHIGSGYRLPEATDANAERLARVMAKREFGRLHFGFDDFDPIKKSHLLSEAAVCLRDMDAAFADPAEKPEPVFAAAPEPPACPSCGRELRAIDATAGVCWKCRSGVPYPPGPTPCGDAKFIPPSGAQPDGSLVTHVVPTQCTATNGGERCEFPTGHGGEHSAERLEWEDADQQKVSPQPAKDPVREGERRKERQRLVWEAMLGMLTVEDPMKMILGGAQEAADVFLAWRDADNEKAMEAYRCKK